MLGKIIGSFKNVPPGPLEGLDAYFFHTSWRMPYQ